jgi:hypothetical protein
MMQLNVKEAQCADIQNKFADGQFALAEDVRVVTPDSFGSAL